MAMHMFHFAAENSICDFYHSEKPFQPFKTGPGAAHFLLPPMRLVVSPFPRT